MKEANCLRHVTHEASIPSSGIKQVGPIEENQ